MEKVRKTNITTNLIHTKTEQDVGVGGLMDGWIDGAVVGAKAVGARAVAARPHQTRPNQKSDA